MLRLEREAEIQMSTTAWKNKNRKAACNRLSLEMMKPLAFVPASYHVCFSKALQLRARAHRGREG